MSGTAGQYPLKRMLTVRAIREDQALRELRLSMAAVEAAAEALKVSIREEADGRASLKASHDAYFAATLGRNVSKSETAPLRRAIDAWKSRVIALEAAVTSARKALADAESACEASRHRHQVRMKDTHKITNHKDAWMTEALKAVEAVADAELEEVRSKDPLKAAAAAAGNDRDDGEDACRR
jgi:hypothetical protein